MAAGLPDRVDCGRLADAGAVLQRVYAIGELPRLQDLLADDHGTVRASVAFEEVGAGRAGATVSVSAEPHLVCQRCLQGFPFAIAATSDIEFADAAYADGEEAATLESQREIYVMDRGQVSLRDLVEEELLLAIPAIASCASPKECGKAPALDEERSRPLAAALRDIWKKT